MRWIALTLAAVAAGCLSTNQRADDNTLSRGQTFQQLERIAHKAGYEVQGYHRGPDVGGVYAYCIPLADGRALLALHDPQAGWIYRLEIVENWSRPASEQVVREVDRFELPATRPAAR